MVIPDVGRSYDEPQVCLNIELQNITELLMSRILYNRTFEARVVQISEEEWGVRILKKGWFKRWEEVYVAHDLMVEEHGYITIDMRYTLLFPFRSGSFFEATAFRNMVATATLLQEHNERELGKKFLVATE